MPNVVDDAIAVLEDAVAVSVAQHNKLKAENERLHSYSAGLESINADLLLALKAAVLCLDSDNPLVSAPQAIKLANTAIDKAEGS